MIIRLNSWALLASLAISALRVSGTPAKRHYDTHRYYALEHKPESDGASLHDVASALGVEVVEQAGALENVWLVRVPRPEVDARDEESGEDPVIGAFEQLKARADSNLSSRAEEDDILFARKVASAVQFLELQTPQELVKRAPPSIRPPTRASAEEVKMRLGLQDPLFTEQWHLVNDEYPEHMMNVTPVWDMGLTGKGIRTSFLDDGLDFEADDLRDAFDEKNSYDFNAHVPLPRPTGARDHHGTRCAGQVVARRNEACGVGIAYDAKAAGVRILGGPISNVDEAAALNYGYDEVDIYSCSWGPRDNGQTMEGPGYLIRKSVVNGINKGRGGKGSIFVFASGNGGRDDDQCNFDGYTNSIYSVTVASIDYMGLHPTYSETCAANMIVAYSSGSGNHIVTTDRGKAECSKRHGGTSAAAPNAVGVFALALQARPDLTWRDIQHLCVETGRHVNPHDPDWEKTASGRLYSYKYGYGALDAYAFVQAAKTWKLVKPQAWYFTETAIFNKGKMHDLGHKKYKYEGGEVIGPDGIEKTMKVTKEDLVKNNFETLEHITVRVWIEHTKRGDVEVEIESPGGIRSVLASTREYDEATTGFPGWRFMTVKHWGEDAVGEWSIRVFDQSDPDHHGKFLGWNMAFWGSAIDPSKATQFVEPTIDNALPPADFPPRPVPNDGDPTATTVHAKPTDHLPEDHGQVTGENSHPAYPKPTTTRAPPKQDDKTNQGDAPDKAWYDHMAGLVAAQKWLFAALAGTTIFGIGGVIYLWRRRLERQRLAQYTSVADDDIGMNALGGSVANAGPAAAGGSRTTRALYDAFGAASGDDLPAREPQPHTNVNANVNPPTGRALGFHSGFLDDDEPSAGLTPKYRDDVPQSGVDVHTSRSAAEEEEEREHDSDSGELVSARNSLEGSRERLT
ncbi:hypothetical protein D9613_006615 [Agrocybe pediades]|uniref:P/Homo B domain-containing protein n=1 Tax=Agrocybe pediades TaxID=84607 RepID=A0A8H4QGZ8_9AGAR|nr:hypothetical protein D9613_006615 [Agrocybe pediades]